MTTLSAPTTVHVCPSFAEHGFMRPRAVDQLSREQAWCGTWFDCTDMTCSSSLLVPSSELARFLRVGGKAVVAATHVPAVPDPPPAATPLKWRESTSAHGYKVLHPVPGMSLHEAREWTRSRYVDRGALCPCCKQVAREYRRTIHAAMAEKLIQFWRTYGTLTWGERTPLMLKGRQGAADGGGDFAKLRYWGLIEEADDNERQDGGKAGWWRVTVDGARFVQNTLAVHRYAYVYDGVSRRVEGPLWNIERCLGKRFHYNELMGFAI
jgi:hypothetical protein